MDAMRISEIKAVTLYLLSKYTDGVDYIKLFKTIYFAHKEYLKDFLEEITPDAFVAQKCGPVPSLTYEVIKIRERNSQPSSELKDFYDSIRVEGKRVYLNTSNKSYLENISPMAQEYLDKWHEACKDKTSKELSEESHDEAYEAAKQNPESNVMTTESIALCAGVSQDSVDYLKDVQRFMEVFG